MYDLNSLKDALGTNVTNSVTTGVQDEFQKLMAWVVVPSIVLTVIVIAVYIAHVVHRHKIDKAIIEIRDTVRELKLAQVAPAEAWPKLDATTSIPQAENPGIPDQPAS